MPLVVQAYQRVAIDLPLNADIPIPAISSTSNAAFKFNVQPGDVFSFADSALPSDVGQWLIVNQLGQVLAAHKRGQPFVASFDKAEQVLLVPRTFAGSVAASTIRRAPHSAITTALSFDADAQFTPQTSGQPGRYTFTIDQATPVFFDSIRAVDGTSWRLRNENGPSLPRTCSSSFARASWSIPDLQG